jgi:hypothetical protein
MTTEPQLQGWKEFCDKHHKDPNFFEPSIARNLNRFRARYLAALNFQSIQMDRASENLKRGYSVGIRLLLSYTAAEVLGSAIGPRIKSWKIYDPKIVRAIRDICKKYTDDQDAISEKKLASLLLAFTNGEHDDLRVPATALRVLVAHGHFAPSGAVYTKRNADAVYGLSSRLLAESERRFTSWLDEQLASEDCNNP